MSDTTSSEYEKSASRDSKVAEFHDERRGVLTHIQHFLHQTPAAVPLIVLILSIAVFGLLLGSKFFSPFALTLILQQVAIVGITAAAQSLVILTAGIDLSVGAIMVFSSVLMGQLTFRYGLPAEISIALGLAAGTLMGVINGVLVAFMRLPPFIVTLGTWQIFLAANFLYSRNETIRSQEIAEQAPALQFFGEKFTIGGAVFTYGVIAMILLVLVLAYALRQTAWGRHVYAVGDDPDAAQLSGVQVRPRPRLGLCAVGPHLRARRLGADRTHRLRLAHLGPARQHRGDHRRGDRRHLALRRARLHRRRPLRRPYRRRLLARPPDGRHRSAVDLHADRRPHHLGGRDRPVDPKGGGMTEPILKARNLVKRYGRVVALDHCDFDLYPGEILAVIGDNGAGKSTLIKALSGAIWPDSGEIVLEGKPVRFGSPLDAREAGIETVYQNLALSPALSIADNMFLGREIRKKGFMGKYLRALDRKEMERRSRELLNELGLLTIQNIGQAVETLSGGQRQGVAVARAAAFGSRVVIMDEPTAALGVKESRRVLELIRDVKARGLPIVLISHNMPHVFEVADRIHIHRLGKRLTVIKPDQYSMSDAVAFMTGAKLPDDVAEAA